MKEEERLRRIQIINQRKVEMQELRKKRKELKELEKNPLVKRYLNLKREVEPLQVLTFSEILKQEMEKKRWDCEHDIFVYRGGRRDEYDHGPEGRDTTYIENDVRKIEYYLYTCLECYHSIEVPKKYHEEFKQNHCILTLRKFVTSVDLNQLHNQYLELLYTNTTEKAYQKLLKKI